jgi:Gpi18-like mannosyltransferase
VLFVLLSSLVARILLFPVQGCAGDLAAFASWFNAAAAHGPVVFYQVVNCDYPPLNVYIFWVFGSFAKLLSVSVSPPLGAPALYLLKLPSTLFDTATAGLIFVFLRRRFSVDTSLLATSFYAFNPATIFNASIWGQFDAIYTFFLVASLILIIEAKPTLSVAAFVAAVLTKPQSIALAPLIVFLLIKNKSLKTVMISVVTSIALVFVVSIPVSPNNLASFLVNIYLKGYTSYSVTSANAFNFWALVGLWKPDSQGFLLLNFFDIGWIMFGALTAIALFCLYRATQRTEKHGRIFEVSVLFTAFILLFGFFMLPTRIHERYLFPVFSVLAMMLPFVKETRPLYGILTFTYLVNLAYVLPFLNAGESQIPNGNPFIYAITTINLAAFAYALAIIIRKPSVTSQISSEVFGNARQSASGDCEPRC